MHPSRKKSMDMPIAAAGAWALHADPAARWNIASPAEPMPVPFARTLERAGELVAAGLDLSNRAIACASLIGRRRIAKPG